MSLRRIPVDPIQTLHERLICHRRAFVHVLAFVFHGLRWTNPWLWDRDVYFDVARLRLGFDDLSRPGDIDMLVVPCIGEEPLWADATAIEVKSYGLSHARRETRSVTRGDGRSKSSPAWLRRRGPAACRSCGGRRGRGTQLPAALTIPARSLRSRCDHPLRTRACRSAAPPGEVE